MCSVRVREMKKRIFGHKKNETESYQTKITAADSFRTLLLFGFGFCYSSRYRWATLSCYQKKKKKEKSYEF